MSTSDAARWPALWAIARTGALSSRTRSRVVALGSAGAGALLLTVLAVLRTPARPVPTGQEVVVVDTYYDPGFSPLVTSAEIRVGVLTGILLVTAAALALVGQALTTGSVRRRRTTRALGLVGVTPGELRAVSALALVRAGLAGGLLAAPLYLVLWAALGPAADPVFRLLPAIGWPDLLGWVVVVLACGGLAAAAGAVTGTARTWLPPLRWVVLGLVTALVAAVAAVPVLGTWDRRAGVAGVGLVVALLLALALTTGTGWAYHRAARLLRSGTAGAVLTAAGLTAAAGPIGTAAAVCLLAGLALGVSSTLLATTLATPVDSVYAGQLPGIALTATAAGSALLIALATATLGAVDDLATHRRTWAATAALGAEPELLHRVHARRLRIATVVPTTTGAAAGALLGTAVTGAGGELIPLTAAVVLSCVATTAGVVLGLSALVSTLLRGRLARAVDPHALRVA
ncbi:hypothetical protein SAMN05660199_03655 [Klenkia soli]|uniref:FtsX-like permease family protein n=1 Tax=Klenkia soli TaxID=1052260 RepID=A0A1H0RWF7_9ACTN|nr:hypothetical protein [Klenkia soli]SDP33745.1 hypothetical protein SAMN05660199_03655 [Klenkia soli]